MAVTLVVRTVGTTAALTAVWRGVLMVGGLVAMMVALLAELKVAELAEWMGS